MCAEGKSSSQRWCGVWRTSPFGAHPEEYGGIEYGGLPINVAVALLLNGFHYRARPRNAIIARSISTSCAAVSRPTRAWTFDLLTVVSLSIMTSLS
jgi:hypothetical protein